MILGDVWPYVCGLEGTHTYAIICVFVLAQETNARHTLVTKCLCTLLGRNTPRALQKASAYLSPLHIDPAW